MLPGISGQFHIRLLRGQAAVNKQEQGLKFPATGQVAVYKFPPFFTFALAAAGITVAGQIHQIIIQRGDPVKIEAARLARRGAYFGQFFASGQGVDQRRLAHIGTSGQGYLGQVKFFELAGQINGVFKFQGDMHEAP